MPGTLNFIYVGLHHRHYISQIQTIDQTRARINTIEAIDFETLAPPDQHMIKIRATDLLVSGIFIEQTFNITILDVNEPPTSIAFATNKWVK